MIFGKENEGKMSEEENKVKVTSWKINILGLFRLLEVVKVELLADEEEVEKYL